jgi:glutathione S-transferase kappa 1
MWKPPNINITIPASLVDVLTDSGLFSDEQIKEIMQKATEKEWKDKLLANTQKALDLGAFGAPWLWVTNGQGISEPFFGSDRYV